MKNYTLSEYKEALKLSEDFLEEICSDSEVFNNKNNKYTITIAYTIPEFLLTAIKSAVENKIIELKEVIDYYDRHAAWLKTNLNCVRCGNCGCYSHYESDFCPSCGFKMDKKFASKKAEEIYTKIRIMELDTLNKIKE